ncbi:MAG: hypothetical protein HN348_28025 [Proteobacteria bacterium]|nr:hypothetical protein [Pseudomonadota bacterium]
MRLQSTTRVNTLLRRHTQAEDILGWYGVRVHNGMDVTLKELCSSYNIDLEDVLIDIKAVVDEDDEDEDENDYRDYDEEEEEEDEDYDDHDDLDLDDWPDDED